jgi:hypothetical protein
VNGNGCVLIADTIQIGNAVPSGTNGPQKTLLPAPTAFPGQGTPAPTTAAGSTPSLSGAPAPLPGD